VDYFAFTPQSKTRHGYEAWARRSARPKISVYWHSNG